MFGEGGKFERESVGGGRHSGVAGGCNSLVLLHPSERRSPSSRFSFRVSSGLI